MNYRPEWEYLAKHKQRHHALRGRRGQRYARGVVCSSGGSQGAADATYAATTGSMGAQCGARIGARATIAFARGQGRPSRGSRSAVHNHRIAGKSKNLFPSIVVSLPWAGPARAQRWAGKGTGRTDGPGSGRERTNGGAEESRDSDTGPTGRPGSAAGAARAVGLPVRPLVPWVDRVGPGARAIAEPSRGRTANAEIRRRSRTGSQ